MILDTRPGTTHNVLLIAPSTKFIVVTGWLVWAITSEYTFVGAAVGYMDTIFRVGFSETSGRYDAFAFWEIKFRVAKSCDIDDTIWVELFKRP